MNTDFAMGNVAPIPPFIFLPDSIIYPFSKKIGFIMQGADI